MDSQQTDTHKPTSALQPVPAAKQERSRRTLERILSVAEELLEERDFDELTMADLAERAGCAVGTVYGRIPNKDSLLMCLYERQNRAAEELAGRLFEACREADLDVRARAVCAFVVDHCAAQSGSIRATTAHLFTREGRDVLQFRREITKAFRSIAGLLAEEMGHLPAEEAQATCEFALLAVCDVAQSRVVFGARSAVRLRYARKELKGRLTTLLLAYLRATD